MINPYMKNLPSTNARPVQPRSTTAITEDSIPNIVKDMHVFARYKENL